MGKGSKWVKGQIGKGSKWVKGQNRLRVKIG